MSAWLLCSASRYKYICVVVVVILFWVCLFVWEGFVFLFFVFCCAFFFFCGGVVVVVYGGLFVFVVIFCFVRINFCISVYFLFVSVQRNRLFLVLKKAFIPKICRAYAGLPCGYSHAT